MNIHCNVQTFKAQYSSQILKHLCAFPLPQCWYGFYSHLSAPKYAWLNIKDWEGHIWVRTMVWRVNVRNFWENSRKTVSVSTICDAHCRYLDSILYHTSYDKPCLHYTNFNCLFCKQFVNRKPWPLLVLMSFFTYQNLSPKNFKDALR